jgi:hypothetical protein
VGCDEYNNRLRVEGQHLRKVLKTFRTAVGAGGEVHIEQENVKGTLPNQLRQAGRIAQDLH